MSKSGDLIFVEKRLFEGLSVPNEIAKWILSQTSPKPVILDQKASPFKSPGNYAQERWKIEEHSITYQLYVWLSSGCAMSLVGFSNRVFLKWGSIWNLGRG